VPRRIDRTQLLELIDRGARLIEVLPRDEYEEEHLPGAENIHLKKLTGESVARLDRDGPVVVYCYDYQ
jgi:rhodanese-related sulfurtransferase